MNTGFESISKEELCREWHTMMETSTFSAICSSIRFLRVCQELDARKLTPFEIAKTIARTNSDSYPVNCEFHQHVE